MIDGTRLIAEQLALQGPKRFDLGHGRSTLLVPGRSSPIGTDPACRSSLDGVWRCLRWPFPKPEAELVGLSVNSDLWPLVRQPGPVFFADPEADVSRIPNWDRVTLAHLDPDDGAILRRKFVLPPSWKGYRLRLRFDGIYPGGRIYLNGSFLGEHLSGLTPVEFDVTERVSPGHPAVVAVRLVRKHGFVQLDMPRHALEFTGLSQPAWMEAVPPLYLEDHHLVGVLSEDLREGRVAGPVHLRNTTARSVEASLRVELISPHRRSVASFSARVSVRAGASALVPVRLATSPVGLWNDEFPYLYELHLEVCADSLPPHRLAWKVGFRRLDLSPDGPRLNGKPVKFRGVNHLTFHPLTGLYTPPAWLRRNLRLMKRANVNAIRTHFLGPRVLADLCNELGLYLLQELPIDWGTHYIHDPEWMGPILTRLEGGVRRDRHQPSVMVWCIGNENLPESDTVADDGWNHLHICDRFVKTLDPHRPTMFPPPGPANRLRGVFELRVGDIADTHYSFRLAREFRRTGRVINPRAWDGTLETTTREEALQRGWSGVWFSSEYGLFNMIPDLMNAPYLSRIADVEENPLSGRTTLQVFLDRMRREWGFMRSDPTCLGGAYFPWLCAGAGKGREGNPWGWVRWGEDADWGVVTADLLPKPFFWALRVVYSPVWFPRRLGWRPGQQDLRFRTTNQCNAIDLAHCTLRTMMTGGGQWMGQMRLFRDIPISCPPGETRTVRIPIWHPPALRSLERGIAIVCRCILLDPRGFRYLTHDILVVPQLARRARTSKIPVGPDATDE